MWKQQRKEQRKIHTRVIGKDKQFGKSLKWLNGANDVYWVLFSVGFSFICLTTNDHLRLDEDNLGKESDTLIFESIKMKMMLMLVFTFNEFYWSFFFWFGGDNMFLRFTSGWWVWVIFNGLVDVCLAFLVIRCFRFWLECAFMWELGNKVK